MNINNIAQIIILVTIGMLSGIFMGSMGIGTGLISMPLLILYGIDFKTSISIIMVMQLLPQSILGVINYWNFIDWYKSFFIILGSMFGIFIGSYIIINNYISEIILYKIFTIVLIVISIYFTKKYLL